MVTQPGANVLPVSRAGKMPNAASKVKTAFQAHRCVYGSPRVHAELHAQGIHCARKRVARLMLGTCDSSPNVHVIAPLPRRVSQGHRWLPICSSATSALISLTANGYEMGTAGFIPVTDGQLYYERDGRGQPLVLLHSGGLHCGEWDDQFAVFSRHYLVVRYDRRGYGRSQMPKQAFSPVQDLHAVLTGLQLVKPALLGFSAGGGIALDFVLTSHDMVRALILVGPSLSGYRGSQARQQELQPLWNAMNHGTIDDVVEAWMKDPAVAPAPEHLPARQRMRELIRDNAHWLMRHPSFSLALPPPALDRLTTVTVPTLVIAGERDASDNVDIVRIIADAIPGAESVIIARAGHHVNLEQPLEFNRVVLDFLSRQMFTALQTWGDT